MIEKDKIRLLVEIILDPNAEDHEKDDAAIDLAKYNDDFALNALIAISRAPFESDQFALENYGETIGTMWLRRDYFNKEVYYTLHSDVQSGIYHVIQHDKPQWIKEYHLE